MEVESKSKKCAFIVYGVVWALVYCGLGSLCMYYLLRANAISDYICGDFLESEGLDPVLMYTKMYCDEL